MKIFCKRTLSGFVPFGDTEFEKFKKFKLGDTYEVEVKLKRNYGFHQKFFAMLNLTFQNQSLTNNFDLFREAVTIEAGFCVEQPLFDGTIQLRAKSISFAKMDQAQFEEVFNRVLDVCLKVVGCTEKEFMNEISRLERELLKFA